MSEIAEVKEMLLLVEVDPFGEASRPLIRWPKDSPSLYRYRLSFDFTMGAHLCKAEMLKEDLSAADIAKEALHAIEQLEGQKTALEQRIADLERDLAAERAFIKRLMEGLRR